MKVDLSVGVISPLLKEEMAIPKKIEIHGMTTVTMNFIDSNIILYYDASLTYFYFPKKKKCYVVKSGIGRLFEEIFEEGKRVKGNQIRDILCLI